MTQKGNDVKAMHSLSQTLYDHQLCPGLEIYKVVTRFNVSTSLFYLLFPII